MKGKIAIFWRPATAVVPHICKLARNMRVVYPINNCLLYIFIFMMSKSKCWFPSWSFSFVMSYCDHIQNSKGYFFIFSKKEVNTLRRQIVNNKAKKANLKTGVSRKQSASNFPKKEHFSPPDTHMYVCLSKGKRYLFFGKFGVLYFLETPVSRFALSGRHPGLIWWRLRHFPNPCEFPNSSRCIFKATIHRRKTVNCFRLLEKNFFQKDAFIIW